MARTLHKGFDVRHLSGLRLALMLLIAIPHAASAATVDQIVALTKAGVAEPVILALIERDKTVFTIEPEQLVNLQRDGVSQTVILAMLKSGRAEGDAQVRADSAQNAAMILSSLSAVPEVVVLGHGPEWPSVARAPYTTAPTVDLLPMPYAFPYAVPYVAGSSQRHRPHRAEQPTFSPTQAAPTVCIEHPSPVGTPPAVGSMGFVTACPPGRR
jgi:hypothetical protein